MSDDEWAFLCPYLTLMREDAPQRGYPLRDLLDALRWVVKTGARWRYLPGDFPPWCAVYQQARRWVAADCFESAAHDLRESLRLAGGRNATPSAAILDGRVIQSTPEGGKRAGYDGHKRRQGSKVHIAVDTRGNLLALVVTPADAQEREPVAESAAAVQEATGQTVTLAYVDQGYTGDQPRPTRRRTASGWRWSSTPRPRRGSCCCRDAGWSSAPSRGSPDSGGWPATTSDWLRRRPGGTGSRPSS